MEDTQCRTTGNTHVITQLMDRLQVLIEEASRTPEQTGGRALRKRSRLRASIQVARRLLEDAHARTVENKRLLSELMERLGALTAESSAMQFASALTPGGVPPEGPATGLEEALRELGIFVGSAVMQMAVERAAIVAQSDQRLPVLLLGETGTGKELFAKLIHRLSSRRHGPMQMVNCAAIPEAVAEDILFGHVRGAFTGADSNRPGVFESAHGGTLFLEELATLPLALQAKLLRVLNEGYVQRLGTQAYRPVDVRVVAATKPNLREEIAAGRFLADLYWRLEVVEISLPPLRERREEIEKLVLWLLRRINQQIRRPRHLSKEALLRLVQHSWPENVRELSSVLKRSVLFSRSETLGPEDIEIRSTPVQDPFAGLPEPGSPGFKVDDFLRQAKAHLYSRALAMSNGNRSAAARLLGVTRQAVSQFVTGQEDNGD